MAKNRQSVLAGVLWVVAIPWLASGARAQEVTPTVGPQDGVGPQEVAAYVTFRVETADGKWMRFTVREHEKATLALLSTGERFSLTPILGSDPGDLQIEVARLGVEKGAEKGVSEPAVERLTAKLGFPSFLADPALLRVDVEAVEMREVPVPKELPGAPLLSTKGRLSGDFEVTDQCCVTCDGIQGCGCFVGASCGSCCDCCGPPAK